MDAAHILNAAADLIEPAGAWTQREFWKGPDGAYSDFSFGFDGEWEVAPWGPQATCYCMLGAIGRVMERDPWNLDDAIIAPVASVLHGYESSNIADWNDDPSRTQEEVVTALRKAAKLAEGEASMTQGDR